MTDNNSSERFECRGCGLGSHKAELNNGRCRRCDCAVDPAVLGTPLTNRLRELQSKVNRGEPALIGCSLDEAADEIQRLRHELRLARAALDGAFV